MTEKELFKIKDRLNEIYRFYKEDGKPLVYARGRAEQRVIEELTKGNNRSVFDAMEIIKKCKRLKYDETNKAPAKVGQEN